MSARATVAAMTAYTLELVQAEVKLNQNESPFDFPFKEEALARIAGNAWNRYPDFESTTLRTALANAYGYSPENILAGNGSNELLAATIGAFVGPGTPVVFAKPTFALYEKLVVIAGGLPVPIDLDPRTGLLPLDAMVNTLTNLRGAVAIVCSPNNPTGGVLEDGGLDRLLATGATVLYDRAYGDFALDELPLLHDQLVTFSTFSKAWGLAALRVGWLASTASTCRQIRKVKLPYSLNVLSENIAAYALEKRDFYENNVARTIAERERVYAAMQRLGIEAFPSKANFIAFRSPVPFEELVERGVLIRKYASFLRVSIGTREENDRFLSVISRDPTPRAILSREDGEGSPPEPPEKILRSAQDDTGPCPPEPPEKILRSAQDDTAAPRVILSREDGEGSSPEPPEKILRSAQDDTAAPRVILSREDGEGSPPEPPEKILRSAQDDTAAPRVILSREDGEGSPPEPPGKILRSAQDDTGPRSPEPPEKILRSAQDDTAAPRVILSREDGEGSSPEPPGRILRSAQDDTGTRSPEPPQGAHDATNEERA